MLSDLRIPKHIALIMDGNARWARARSLPLVAGHKAGIRAMEKVVQRAGELGVEYVTLFTFSTENWMRDNEWINEFMKLMRWYLQNASDIFMENDIKVNFIGNASAFSQDIQQSLKKIEELTANNQTITLNFAISYSGKDDIKRAMKKIMHKVQLGELNVDDISEDLISQHLDTSGFPDPDLLIRTSGEVRLSNFMLWQSAYTELYFEKSYWPDFTPKHLEAAIEEFSRRNRRYGTYSAAA